MFARLSITLCLLASLTSFGVLAEHIVVRDRHITLPTAKKVQTTGMANVLKIDQSRAKGLKHKVDKAAMSRQRRAPAIEDVPITSYATQYLINVTIGNPPQPFQLQVDTGSANTWFGAGQYLAPPPSSTATGQDLDLEYGSDAVMLGSEYIDQIELAPGFTIHNQSLGLSLAAVGFQDGIDGILGVGPEVLTYATLFPNQTSFVPTVTDNAFWQGLVPEHSIGIFFAPTGSMDGVTNGEIHFGGADSSKYTGELNYVPITTTYPSSRYVGINQTITYGSSNTPILSNNAGITDTGTTLILIATDAFQAYQAATGAVADPNIGLLRLTPAQYSNLESLFFKIGDDTYELTPNAQAWPRTLNSVIGGSDDFIYLMVNDIGTPSGYGFDFINGMTFLERFYSVYDAAQNRFGIANTQFTHAVVGETN